MWIFIIILLVNTLVAALYLIWNLLRRKEKNRSCWFKALVMFLCPVVGPCFFLLSYVFYLLFFFEPVDLADVVFSKERVKTFTYAEDSERNLVPLEEAIEITDTDDLRSLMMSVVRGDIHKSLAAISLALNSRDTETAHYAAAVLQEALNEFGINVQRQYKLVLEETEEQASVAEALVDYMNRVLEQHVFTDMEQRRYVDMMQEVCEILYERDYTRVTSSMYEAVSLRLLEMEEYEQCRKWCKRAAEQYPNSLATYTCQLKLYFNSGQKQQFFEVIEALKQSTVVVDSETLELIRVFR